MDEKQMTQKEINEKIEKEMVIVRENNIESLIDGIMFLAILFNVLVACKFLILPLLFI